MPSPPFGYSVLAAVLAALVPLMPPSAAAQTKSESAGPSFRDERRWVPKSVEPASAGPAAKPAAVVAPTPTPAAAACAAPAVKATAMSAGLMRIALSSGCRPGQSFVWTYGGGEFQAVFDSAGNAEVIVDGFAGTSTTVDFKFTADGLLSLPFEGLDLDKVAKIAVLWRAPVNLDVHAFEYAATTGQPGHISAAAPSSLASAREWMEKSARGHGFLSTDGRSGAGLDQIEVYTFLHKDGQAPGLVTTAIDYETRGEQPAGETCGAGKHAEVQFRVVSLTRQGQITRELGVIASVDCGRALPQKARLNPGLLPVIRIRN